MVGRSGSRCSGGGTGGPIQKVNIAIFIDVEVGEGQPINAVPDMRGNASVKHTFTVRA